MVHWHPVPVANQLLILITKLASYIFSDYKIGYITVCQSLVAWELLCSYNKDMKLKATRDGWIKISYSKNASIGIMIVYF